MKKTSPCQVRVQKSKIHGYGIFALQDMTRGTVIEHSSRSRNYGGYNHSCAANTVLARVKKQKFGTNILVVLFKDVKKGEELTVSYGWKFANAGTVDGSFCNCPLHRAD